MDIRPWKYYAGFSKLLLSACYIEGTDITIDE